MPGPRPAVDARGRDSGALGRRAGPPAGGRCPESVQGVSPHGVRVSVVRGAGSRCRRPRARGHRGDAHHHRDRDDRGGGGDQDGSNRVPGAGDPRAGRGGDGARARGAACALDERSGNASDSPNATGHGRAASTRSSPTSPIPTRAPGTREDTLPRFAMALSPELRERRFLARNLPSAMPEPAPRRSSRHGRVRSGGPATYPHCDYGKAFMAGTCALGGQSAGERVG